MFDLTKTGAPGLSTSDNLERGSFQAVKMAVGKLAYKKRLRNLLVCFFFQQHVP